MSRPTAPPDDSSRDKAQPQRSAQGFALLTRLVPIVVSLATVLLLAIHHLPQIAAFWAAMLRWPYPMQGSESLIVWEAQRLAQGESIYVANSPTAHGFVSGPYTPLYFAAVATTLKVSSTVYTGGRLITLIAWVALLIIAGVIAHGATTRRVRWLGAVVAVANLAVFTPGIIWAVRVKPTIPALALAALGLLIVQRTWSSPRQHYLWALVPFVAAYFAKQTALAAPLAAVLFLLAHAGWRVAARFVGVGIVGGLVPFGLLTLLTRGEFFRHIIADRRLAWQPQLVLNFGGLFLRDYWPLLVAAVLATLVLLWWRTPSIAPIYLLCAAAFVVTIGVEGADHDHLIELAFAAAVAAGSGLVVVLGRATREQLLAWPLVACLVLQLGTGWTPDRWYAGEYAQPDPRIRQQLDLIVTNVRNTPGDVLAEEIGLILLAGKPVPYDDPQAMAALARVGRWDQQQLLDDLNARRFKLVLLPANPRDELWTPEVLAAIAANYDLKFRDVWFTYEAKPSR
jgi:hypothetical protein